MLAETIFAIGLAGAAALPADAACDRRLAVAIAGAPPSTVPAACWRVGPLRLGMSADALRAEMGVPVQTGEVASGLGRSHRYQAQVYAFPRGWRPYAKGAAPAQARLRFVEVLLDGGRVVQIDNDAAVRTSFPACARPAPPLDEGEGEPPDFKPFDGFAGVRTGAPEGDLARRFGRPPGRNASHDWLSYLPVPLTFDADPETRRITGFTIAADGDAATREDEVRMRVTVDPATCQPVSAIFGSDQADAAQRRPSR